MIRQLAWFLVAGGTGFAIDAGLLFLLTEYAGFHPVLARVPSFAVAVVATFFINRHYTFQAAHQSPGRAFVTYLSSNALSQGFNFLLYTALVTGVDFFHAMPVAALAISSLVAMFLSFFLFKRWVFKSHEISEIQ